MTSWGLFPDAVREGASQAKKALGVDIFDYLARPDNAGEAALFAGSMADLSSPSRVRCTSPTPRESRPWSTSGEPTGSSSWMAAHPHLFGEVLDLPHAVEGARAEAA